jgi:hypothetical protein
MDATQEYRIVSTAKINAVVNVQYDKSEHENISYVVYEIVKKYLPAMRKNKVDLILPREIFAEGADSPNRPGTRSWFEDSINELLGWKSGEERYVEIKVYSDTVMEGMEKALSRSIRPGAIGVIGATKAQIERSSSDMAIRDTIQKKKVRIMSLPNIGKDDPLKTLPGEYSLTRDIALTGLMQAMLNQGTIIKATSLATDMEVLLSQLVGRRITRQELCYLLPYDEAEATIKLLDEAWEEKEFTVEELLKNLLALTLKPIRPYDARKQLEMRKKVMYSV